MSHLSGKWYPRTHSLIRRDINYMESGRVSIFCYGDILCRHILQLWNWGGQVACIWTSSFYLLLNLRLTLLPRILDIWFQFLTKAECKNSCCSIDLPNSFNIESCITKYGVNTWPYERCMQNPHWLLLGQSFTHAFTKSWKVFKNRPWICVCQSDTCHSITVISTYNNISLLWPRKYK